MSDKSVSFKIIDNDKTHSGYNIFLAMKYFLAFYFDGRKNFSDVINAMSMTPSKEEFDEIPVWVDSNNPEANFSIKVEKEETDDKIIYHLDISALKDLAQTPFSFESLVDMISNSSESHVKSFINIFANLQEAYSDFNTSFYEYLESKTNNEEILSCVQFSIERNFKSKWEKQVAIAKLHLFMINKQTQDRWDELIKECTKNLNELKDSLYAKIDEVLELLDLSDEAVETKIYRKDPIGFTVKRYEEAIENMYKFKTDLIAHISKAWDQNKKFNCAAHKSIEITREDVRVKAEKVYTEFKMLHHMMLDHFSKLSDDEQIKKLRTDAVHMFDEWNDTTLTIDEITSVMID